jgi:hypothetical protein
LSGGNAANAVYSPDLNFVFAPKGQGLYNTDRNNFSPYVGFAWKVGDRLPLVIRGAYNISYVNDDLLRNTSVFALQNPFQSFQVFEDLSGSPTPLQNAPSVPAPTLPGSLTLQSLQALAYNSPNNELFAPPGRVFAVDQNLRTPYVQQVNLGIETQVSGFQLAARYVGNRLEKGLRSVDRNQVTLSPAFLSAFQQARQLNDGTFPGFPSDFFANDSTFANLVQTGQAGELARYFAAGLHIYQNAGYLIPGYGGTGFFGNPNAPNGILLLSNLGRSRYDALQLTAARRVGSGLNLTANYAFSKTLGNLDDYAQGAVDPYLDLHNPRTEWAPSPFNLRHAFKSTAIYDLPFANRLASNSLAHKVLDGWSVSGFLIAQSGAPFSLLSSLGTLNAASPIGLGYVPGPGRSDSLENTVSTSLTAGQIGQYFGIRENPNGIVTYVNAPASAFQSPAPGTDGNLQRRMFSGPGTFNLSVGLRKMITISERAKLEIRAESINVLNKVNWLVGDQTYQGTGGTYPFDNNVVQWTPPRVVQFHLRLAF